MERMLASLELGIDVVINQVAISANEKMRFLCRAISGIQALVKMAKSAIKTASDTKAKVKCQSETPTYESKLRRNVRASCGNAL